MSERVILIVIVLTYLLMGDTKAVLPSDEIDAQKSSAAYQFTAQLEALEPEERSNTGGLHMGRATGCVLKVTRAPQGASSGVLHDGDAVSFRVPIWAWAERDREPPGPDRLYWGPEAPPVRLEVWGSFRGDHFVVSVFEAIDSDESDESVRAVLERIERIETAFVAARDADLRSDFKGVTGLHLEPLDPDGEAFQANAPASDGWALSASYRRAREARILVVSLGGPVCVRCADVTARHGSDARPVPVSPHRKLPATWYLRYARPWGSISFGFRMTQPHDYDDCMVQVSFSDES